MDLELNGKVVLIAESCDRYAAALTRAVRREGAAVVLCAEGSALLDMEAETCFACDLSDPVEARRLRDGIAERFGRLDAVIFHHDITEPMGLLQMDAAGFQRRLLPARAAFVCCQVFGQYIGGLGRGGSIVLITTLHDEKPNGSDFAHSVAQGMIENLAMEAALEYGEAGVRVNQIALGAAEGDGERFPSDITTFYEGARFKAPAGRLVTAADLADLSLYLISGRAGFISGARMRMDGGLMLHYIDPKANYRAWRASEEGR